MAVLVAVGGCGGTSARGGFTVVELGGDLGVTALSAFGLLRDARTAPFVSGRGCVTVSGTDAAEGLSRIL